MIHLSREAIQAVGGGVSGGVNHELHGILWIAVLLGPEMRVGKVALYFDKLSVEQHANFLRGSRVKQAVGYLVFRWDGGITRTSGVKPRVILGDLKGSQTLFIYQYLLYLGTKASGDF